MDIILYIISILLIIFIELKLDNMIIKIYKNPIFKLIFLFMIYLYGENNIIFTILSSTYYIYLDQKIKENEQSNY